MTNLYNKEVPGRRSSMMWRKAGLEDTLCSFFFSFCMDSGFRIQVTCLVQTANLLSLSGNPGTLRPRIFFHFLIFSESGVPGHRLRSGAAVRLFFGSFIQSICVYINPYKIYRQPQRGEPSGLHREAVRSMPGFPQDSIMISSRFSTILS